jgi:hypothetical protein
MGINLKDIKTGGEPVTEGRYTVTVEKAELTTAKSGNPTINVTFKIEDGPFAGRFLWDNFTLVQNSFWKLKGLLEAAKSDLTQESDVSEQEIAQRLEGLRVSVFATPGLTNTGNAKSVLSDYTAVDAPAKGSSLFS